MSILDEENWIDGSSSSNCSGNGSVTGYNLGGPIAAVVDGTDCARDGGPSQSLHVYYNDYFHHDLREAFWH